jgi:hypothetical protein
VTGWCTALLLACTIACADPTGSTAPVVGDRVMVIYHGAPHVGYRPAYQPDSLIRYLVGFRNGKPHARISTAVVVNELYSPTHRRALATWACPQLGNPCATGSDWDEWLDTTITFLAKLNSAAARADEWFGPRRIGVVPALLYPDPMVDTIAFAGKTYRMPAQRVDLVRAYADSLEARFARANLKHLKLFAYYWPHESVADERRDSLITPRIGRIANRRGRELWWIPYWSSPSTNWRGYGFNRVWIQPNHYFTNAPDKRLQEAVSLAHFNAMGLTIEFQRGGPFTRLDPYLAAAKEVESLAVYEGGGALLELEQKDPGRYNRLVDVLAF